MVTLTLYFSKLYSLEFTHLTVGLSSTVDEGPAPANGNFNFFCFFLIK